MTHGGPTPRFIQQLARRRMKGTGENYTTARRAVLADVEGNRAKYGKKKGDT